MYCSAQLFGQWKDSKYKNVNFSYLVILKWKERYQITFASKTNVIFYDQFSDSIQNWSIQHPDICNLVPHCVGLNLTLFPKLLPFIHILLYPSITKSFPNVWRHFWLTLCKIFRARESYLNLLEQQMQENYDKHRHHSTSSSPLKKLSQVLKYVFLFFSGPTR